MKRRYVGVYVDPQSKEYQAIQPYLERIARGESFTIDQIAKLVKTSRSNVQRTYSHFLKHMNRIEIQIKNETF